MPENQPNPPVGRLPSAGVPKPSAGVPKPSAGVPKPSAGVPPPPAGVPKPTADAGQGAPAHSAVVGRLPSAGVPVPPTGVPVPTADASGGAPAAAGSGDPAYKGTPPPSGVPVSSSGPPALPAEPPPRRLRRLHRVWPDRDGNISYLVTICVDGRGRILDNDDTFQRLTAFLLDSPVRYRWFPRRFVVMPDHLHVIAHQGREAIRLGQWIKALKAVVGGLKPRDDAPMAPGERPVGAPAPQPVGRLPSAGVPLPPSAVPPPPADIAEAAPAHPGAREAAGSGDPAYRAPHAIVGRLPSAGAPLPSAGVPPPPADTAEAAPAHPGAREAAGSGDPAYRAPHAIVGRLPSAGVPLPSPGPTPHEFTRLQRPWRWQEGFHDHKFRTPESEQRKWEYICLNPVRYGLVARPEQWPFGGEIFHEQAGEPRLLQGTPPLLETSLLVNEGGSAHGGGNAPAEGSRPTT